MWPLDVMYPLLFWLLEFSCPWPDAPSLAGNGGGGGTMDPGAPVYL
jgi:hypothetical protein